MKTKIRIFAILASMLMLTVIAMPMVEATRPTTRQNRTRININQLASPPIPPHREYTESPLHLIEICPTIESSTPYFRLLIAAACDDRQEIIFEAIENYSQASEKEQKALKEFMENIWEKYPVIYKIADEDYLINEKIWHPLFYENDDINNGNIITLYQFDMDEINAQHINLTDAENEMLGKVFESLSIRAASLTNTYNNVRDIGSDTGFGILWRSVNPPGENHPGNLIHQDMTRIAVSRWTTTNWFIETAASTSGKPDDSSPGGWIDRNQVGQFRDDCWFDRWVFDTIIRPGFGGCERSALRKWTHAYINLNVGRWVGGAPEEARRFGVRARNYVNTRQWTNASRNIGYSSHFLTDVGQPMHTGRAFVQLIQSRIIVTQPCIHSVQYYNFIRNNWQSGENFRGDAVRDNISWWFTGATDSRNCPDFATKQLASYSNRYVNRLVDGILFAGLPGFPRNWQNCPEIIRISENVIVATMRWNRGLAWHALQDWLPRRI